MKYKVNNFFHFNKGGGVLVISWENFEDGKVACWVKKSSCKIICNNSFHLEK